MPRRGLSEHLHAGENEPNMQMWGGKLIIFCKHILIVATWEKEKLKYRAEISVNSSRGVKAK